MLWGMGVWDSPAPSPPPERGSVLCNVPAASRASHFGGDRKQYWHGHLTIEFNPVIKQRDGGHRNTLDFRCFLNAGAHECRE
jgi:hypothetical protein